MNVNHYRLWCNTEAGYVFIWNDEVPEVCPNNNTHDIDTNSISIINHVNEETVIVKEELGQPTGGHIRIASRAFDAAANTTTLYNFSYPIRAAVINVQIPTNDNQEGDILNFYMAPDTPIGVLTGNIIETDNILPVSQSVIDNVKVGYLISIEGENLGQILSIDKVNNTITTEFSCINAHNAGVLVLLTIAYIQDLELGRGWVYNLGSAKIGASTAEAGTPFRIVYINNSAEVKRVRIMFEILY